MLYNANEVEPHLALELTERLIRLASSTCTDDDDADEVRSSNRPMFTHSTFWSF